MQRKRVTQDRKRSGTGIKGSWRIDAVKRDLSVYVMARIRHQPATAAAPLTPPSPPRLYALARCFASSALAAFLHRSGVRSCVP